MNEADLKRLMAAIIYSGQFIGIKDLSKKVNQIFNSYNYIEDEIKQEEYDKAYRKARAPKP